MTELLDRKRSVTRNDEPMGAFTVIGDIGLFSAGGWVHVEQPGLPRYWTPQRDLVLQQTLHMETMWASAVAKSVTKQAALGFTLTDADKRDRVINQAQKTLLWFDGSVWSLGLQKHIQQFLLCDNGAFVEIERVSRAPWSRVRALWHLDSAACLRTGHAEYPVVYTDARGVLHRLRYDQVLLFADQPSPRRDMRGVGLSAASRAWQTILKLTAVETYFREKITGRRSLAVHIVNGVSQTQLEDALTTAEEHTRQKGFVVYQGVTILPTVKMDTPPTVVTIPLAEVPDGFDVDQERRDAYLRYANALGVPVQDIQPLSGQGLGTGTQTVILNEEAEGYGLAAWRRMFVQALNTFVLPQGVTFAFANTADVREQQAKAALLKARADAWNVLIAAGVLTPAQVLNLAVDSGDVPEALLPAPDLTPGTQLTDADALGVEKAARLIEPTDAPGAAPAPNSLDRLIDAVVANATAQATEALHAD